MLSTAAKMEVARVLYALVRGVRGLLGREDSVVVTRRGVRWRLDLGEGIDLTIYLAGAFERPTLRQLERLVRPGMNVIDVGANVGAHALHLARLVGAAGSVTAVEPTSFAVRKLRANLAENPALSSRVEVRQCFLVGEPGMAVRPAIASSWPVDGRRPDDHALGSVSMSTEGAAAETLDDVLESSPKRRIQLIKMDVDGHELEVLRGARVVLTRDRPAIVMELAPYVFARQEDFDAVLSLLWELDYDFTPIGGSRPLARTIAAVRDRIPKNGSLNVTAISQTAAAGTRLET
jgi:FkbM family methyltransferase